MPRHAAPRSQQTRSVSACSGSTACPSGSHRQRHPSLPGPSPSLLSSVAAPGHHPLSSSPKPGTSARRMHHDLARSHPPPCANLRTQQVASTAGAASTTSSGPTSPSPSKLLRRSISPPTASSPSAPNSSPTCALRDPARFRDSTIRWKSRKVFVSQLLHSYEVGLEQIADGVWSVFFGPVHLGWLDETDFRIMDVQRNKKRRNRREL
jgi:hypothetical protein